MSHHALRKSRGSDNHCTDCCAVTCWKCCMKKYIRNNKTDIKKMKKNEKKKWNEKKMKNEKNGKKKMGKKM
jgi:thymidylate synthase